MPINQIMTPNTEQKLKEPEPSAETNELKVMTDEKTAQLITLKEVFEKAETEKTVIEASIVRMAET